MPRWLPAVLVYEALLAARKLSTENQLSVSVIDMETIKPFDEQTVVRAAKQTGYVVTAEEHNILGGLGGAVCEVLSESNPTLVRRIGTRDTFGESGESGELMNKYGLSARNIADKVLELRSIGRK